MEVMNVLQILFSSSIQQLLFTLNVAVSRREDITFKLKLNINIDTW